MNPDGCSSSVKPYFKRICVFVLTVSLVLSLPSCSLKGGGKPENDGLYNSAPQADDFSTTAVLRFIFPGQAKSDTGKVLSEIEAKTRDTLNIKLDFQWVPAGEYAGRVVLSSVSNDSYDAFYYSDGFDYKACIKPEYAGLKLKDLLDKRIPMNISKLLPKYAPGLYKKLSQDELAACTVDNMLIAVPCHFPEANRMCAIVREDLVKKLNIGEIRSFDDYERYLQKVKESEKDLIPVFLYYGTLRTFAEAYGYVVFSEALGLVYRWDDPAMKLMAWETTQGYKSSVETLKRWYDRDYVSRDLGIIQKYDFSSIAGGRFASCIDRMPAEHEINSTARNGILPGMRYKAYPLYRDKPSQLLSPMSNCFIINANARNPERTLMFLDWVQSAQENYDLLMYGIKGEHYTLYGDQYNLPKGVSPDKSAYAGWPGQAAFMNIDLFRSSIFDDPEFRRNYSSYVGSGTKYAPHQGFYPDYEVLKSEFENRSAAFYRNDRPTPGMIFSYDSVESYVNSRYDGTADKLIKELQGQLDKWSMGRK